MMIIQVLAALGGLGALYIAGGCDDSDNSVSPDVLSAQERARKQIEEYAKIPPRPTTQELLNGPTKTLRLAEFPLSLDVPQSWELKTSDTGVLMVVGPASSADVEIHLSNPGLRVGQLDVQLARMKSEADAKPHPLNKVEMRDLGNGVKVLEQRMISTAFVDGKLPPEREEDIVIGDPSKGPTVTTRAVVNPHMMQWTLTIYIPEKEEKYATRALNFMMLQVSEFKRDREFLERTVGSLKYVK
jgi:hypothetical protein